jgi:rhodanese-related sulfurtransferase
MKENNRTRRLSIASVIFIAIIIIGLITIRKPDIEYRLNPQQTLDAIVESPEEIYPEDVRNFAEFKETGYVIVDLRSPYEFVKGNIPGSVNIPSNALLDKESLKAFEKYVQDSLTVILIAETQSEANGPWMLLRQLGYNNLKVMLGGWNYYANPTDPNDMPEIPPYMVEKARFDFMAIMDSLGSNTNSAQPDNSPEVILPTRKKKSSKVEGGC